MKKTLPLTLYSLAFLTACGGGGSSSTSAPSNPNTPPANPALSGQFIDSPVHGLNYVSDSQSGTTDENGTFQYLEGETVEFFLGDLSIGQVDGTEVATPLTLEAADDTEQHGDFAINLLRLLQTLDPDPSNGITLDPNISGSNLVDLNKSIEDFENDPNIGQFLSANTNTSTLVSTASAVAHFQTTLDNLGNDYHLELSGTEWSSVITTDYCEEGINGGLYYTFSDSEVTSTGVDEFISNNFENCSLGEAETDIDSYSSEPDFPLLCGPVCTYGDLNKVISGTEPNGVEFLTTVSHVPGSDIVTFTKRVLADPNSQGFMPHSFKEVITKKSPLIGSWHHAGENNTVITFINATHYFVTQNIDDVGEPLCADGMEWGTYEWNAETGDTVLTNIVDTTGDCGMTSAEGNVYETNFTVANNTLTLNDVGGSIDLALLDSGNNDLIGSWYGNGENKTVITFIDANTYFVAQNVDEVGEPLCSDGMEWGNYTWNIATGDISFTNVVDTTGDCGLTSSQGATYDAVFTASDYALTVSDNEGTFILPRINPIH